MLYMLYTNKYYTILAHWGFTHFLSSFLSFLHCLWAADGRTLEKPILRGLIPDRVRRALAARDGRQEGLERWRDDFVRSRL